MSTSVSLQQFDWPIAICKSLESNLKLLFLNCNDIMRLRNEKK